MDRLALVCLLFFGLFFFQAPASLAAEKSVDSAKVLVFNTGVGAPYVYEGPKQGFLEVLLEEMAGRIGYKAVVNVYPSAERALMNANAGREDGDALRVAGLSKIYPNLIPIPESILHNDFVGYTRGTAPPIDGWRSLDRLVVGYIIGWKIFEANTETVKNRAALQGVEQMFTLLKLGRLDVALYERWQGLWQAGQAGVQVTVIEPPFASLEMFSYLHMRHAHLAPKLAEVLRELKADGTHSHLVQAYLSESITKMDGAP